MSAPVIEIAYLYLNAGIELKTGDAQEIWQQTLQTIAAQEGCKSVYWGMQLENPDTAQLAIEWESIADHEKFMASTPYGPFLSAITTLLASPPKIFHLRLPALSSALSAPVTEAFNLYFATSQSEAAFASNFQSFVEAAGKVPNESQGIEGGWSVEEHDLEVVQKEGKGKMFGCFIGWPSVEAHQRFRAQEGFRDVVGLLTPGAVGRSVHHVAFEKYQG